jgi:hypothetical protein
MERRRAITTAAAASLTLLAGATGIALNAGVVGAHGDGTVGRLTPLGTATAPRTLVAPVGAATATAITASPPVQATDCRPVATSSASGTPDGSRYHDEHEDEHEHDDHAYEGADDDD